MKTKLLLLILLAFAFTNYKAKANETEPNNSWNQANTLSLNGSNNGDMNPAADIDWWKVTTTGDGAINLSLTSTDGQPIFFDLYDTLGSIALHTGTYTYGSTNYTVDGLAQGTYYIKIHCYYGTDTGRYTISNTFTTPLQANDAEPNNSRAQAKALPLNRSKTGHIDYYYNNHRDSVDWYKVTTNADGRLRLTMSSANGQNVWAYLYDNDGTTLLGSAYTAGTSVLVNKDGLTAGTYYIRINTYYNTEFAPYTLSDSLFVPAEANDAEPDSSKAIALTLPLNGSVTGHIGYYYNNHRDSVDEYKLTTNADGNINLSLSIPNNTPVWFALYDNDGTTLIHQDYTAGNFNYNVDGLGNGTYYIRIFCYYNSQFAPYTLSNILSPYTNANDAEPNNYFAQAENVSPNNTTTGHVNFYYNGARDSVDYYKIDYTGSDGNMTLVFNQENRHISGSAAPTWFRVYKADTTTLISNSYYSSASGNINLTGLAKGYYYIQVITYYQTDFSSYSFSNNFTETAPEIIVTTGTDTAADCSYANTLVYKFTKVSPPFTVQLYRFGAPYGLPVTANSNKYTFSNLPDGAYYAVVTAIGATVSGTSKTIGIMPAPTGLTTTNIKQTSAKLNWDTVACAKYFIVQYKAHNAATWINKKPAGNVKSYVLKNLIEGITYDWSVASDDSANGTIAQSEYADSISFTTLATLIADNNDSEDDLSINSNKNVGIILIAPNPASNYFIIHYNASVKQQLVATLYDVNGKPVWTSGSITSDALNGKQVTVSQFGSGFYYLKITDDKGAIIIATKISVIK